VYLTNEIFSNQDDEYINEKLAEFKTVECGSKIWRICRWYGNGGVLMV